jgi:prevent-host-death family protein
MEKFVSATEASRNFAQLLRDIRRGMSYVVTSDGKPVARIIPADEGYASRDAAWAALLERLQSQPVIEVEPWTRDDLHDE